MPDDVAAAGPIEPSIPLEPPAPPARWRGLWVLLLLTAAGAALRFYHIERPTLWGDEVATYSRVTGTFGRLMGILRSEGFVPLHYISYWALGKVTMLTPLLMRLLPALAGVAFIPAIYLLARQMFNRRTALLAALLATTSAFGMTYSRDAKMYMQTWFMLTLFAGLLLMWWRTKRWWLWPLWVLSGAAAAMLHATAMLVIALVPLMLAGGAAKFRKRDLPLAVIGLAIIFAPPVGYYLGYNKYLERTRIVPLETFDNGDAQWGHSGLDWIEQFNQGQGPWTLTLNSAAGYLAGLQWPRDRIDPGGFDMAQQPWFRSACLAVMSVLLGVLAIGAWPWPMRWRGGANLSPSGGDAEHREAEGVRRAEPSTGQCSAAQGDPDTPSCRSATSSPEGGGVCADASVQPAWRAWYWLAIWLVLPTYAVFYCRSYNDFVSPAHWAVVVWGAMGWWWLAVGAGAAVMGWLGGLRRWSTCGLIGAWWLLIGVTIAVAVAQGPLDWAHRWAGYFANPWLLGVAAAIGAAAWYVASGSTTRQRLLVVGRAAAVAAVIVLLCGAAWLGWNLVHAKYLQRHDGVGWQSIWMPRYLGIAYPAALVASAALLMRVPTRPLRWLAVTMFIGVNLTQGLARVIVDTEPPTDRVANDVWQAHEEAAVLTVINLAGRGTAGGRWFGGWREEYYLNVASGRMENTDDFRSSQMLRQLKVMHHPRGDALKAALDAEPSPRMLIAWDRFGSSQVVADAPVRQLDPQWVEQERSVYRTRQFWTWRDGDWYRRIVYRRVEAPLPAQPVP